MRILAVDDNHLDAIVSKLEEYDFLEIHRADTGMKALALTEMRSYDIIIMDFELPDITGLEVVKRIREIDTETYIIGYSAHWEEHSSMVDDWTYGCIREAVNRYLDNIS